MARRLYLGLLLVLSACTSPTGTTTVTKPLTEAIDPQSVVSVEVKPGPDAQAADVIRDLRRELFAGLVSDGLFHQAVQPGEPSDYRLVVTLKEVRVVGNFGRFMGGAFAGPDRITADILLLRDGSASPILASSIVADSAVTITGRNDIQAASDEAVDLILGALRKK